ncbi:hypothetical protein [Geodermatophilus sp. URMC 64]
MSPLRWDVLGVGFVLALPLLALYLHGDLTVEAMTGRLPWCLVAGYVVVALLRWAGRPRDEAPAGAIEPAEPEPSPTI